MTGLIGKAIVHADLRLVTGTRVGGSQGGLKIGGVDLNVISDAWGRPYIPGSSLKGKLRSLLERKLNVRFSDRGVHSCRSAEDYNTCDICRIFGVLGGGIEAPTLTRLVARDAYLDETSITDDMHSNLETQFTEVKSETAIDRVRGTALQGSLRQVERVPAGAIFRPCEFVFNVFADADKDLFKQLFVAMELLEDDYLGGMGSRGYGKVALENLRVWWHSRQDYETGNVDVAQKTALNREFNTPRLLVANFDALKTSLA